MFDWTPLVAIGISVGALIVSVLGYLDESHKRRLLEKLVKQLARLVKSHEKQVTAFQRLSIGKSAEEIKLEKDKLLWDQIKTAGRALGLDVDE